MPSVPVGLNVWSRLVDATFPYLDQTVGAFDSIWLPDHVQYGANQVAEAVVPPVRVLRHGAEQVLLAVPTDHHGRD